MLGLQGKVAFVFGVASEESIAWGICKRLAEAGVSLYLGYQKRFMSRVFKLKDELDAIAGFYPLDVASDETTAEFFSSFSQENPGLKADVAVPSVAHPQTSGLVLAKIWRQARDLVPITTIEGGAADIVGRSG